MATKRKPTPAQIAARERFAAMARSGAFKKKATKARKKNPMVISKQADESLSRQGSRGYVRKLLDRYSDEGHVVSVKKTRSGSIGIAFDGGRMLTVASARKKLEDHYGITERMGRRSNPRASNPVASKRKRNPVKPKVPKYTVQTLISDKAKWKRVAMFDSLEQAKAYAEAVPRAYKVVAVRVIDDK